MMGPGSRTRTVRQHRKLDGTVEIGTRNVAGACCSCSDCLVGLLLTRNPDRHCKTVPQTVLLQLLPVVCQPALFVAL